MTSHTNTFLPKNQGALSFRQTRQKSQDENMIKISKNTPLDENKENVSKNIVIDQKNVNKFPSFFPKNIKNLKQF